MPKASLYERIFRNFGFAEVTFTRYYERKKHYSFVLRSFFRNFGFAEVTMRSEMQRKMDFPFAFHSLFRNFAHKLIKTANEN